MRRLQLLLLRLLRHLGAARARSRGRHRALPRQSGEHRPLLSGRRRPRQHRLQPDHPGGEPGRKPRGLLRQQRDLRHDRRPDGADHAARAEDADLALRAQCLQRGISAESFRNGRRTRRAGLCGAGCAEHGSTDPQGASRGAQGDLQQHRTQRVLAGGVSQRLPGEPQDAREGDE